MFILKEIYNLFSFYYYCLIFNKSKFYHKSIIKNSVFGKNNIISANCLLNKITVSDFSYVGKNSTIEYTTIGKYCSIGQNVLINLPLHPLNKNISTHPFFYSTKYSNLNNLNTTTIKEFKNVKIGNDVWIGSNVIILGGIEIGDGAVIGAGSVVTKNIGNYEIHVGVPNKLIRKRFTDNQIRSLLESKWWDRPIDIKKINLYNDIDQFLFNE